jgi:hypothetical protein
MHVMVLHILSSNINCYQNTGSDCCVECLQSFLMQCCVTGYAVPRILKAPQSLETICNYSSTHTASHRKRLTYFDNGEGV